jgi:peptidoglycan/LPS O-acetylase OafA/YrhL
VQRFSSEESQIGYFDGSRGSYVRNSLTGRPAMGLNISPVSQPTNSRNHALDLMRACAIVIIFAHHLIAGGPFQGRWLQYAENGKFGVDLFFALSGWLIGSIYWKEYRRNKGVQLWQFLLRRWIRTIPPYLIILAISWMAVWITRKQPFDIGYLIFIQNYYQTIPFFLVSWSLCVEEHFYLLLPIILALWLYYRLSPHWLFALLVIVAPLCRFLITQQHGISSDFGFDITATHLRMEGLLLGFWASYVSILFPSYWNRIKRFAPLLVLVAIGLIAVSAVTELWFYRIGLTAVAILSIAVLVSLVEWKVNLFGAYKFVRPIALSSYSVYLVHPIMIHAATILMSRYTAIPPVFYYVIGTLFTACGGTIFYFAVEKTSLDLRERITPSSKPSPIPILESGAPSS